MPISRLSSIPRRHYLGCFLAGLIGWYVTAQVWPVDASFKAEDWQAYAATLASVASSMVGLTVAVTALVYALLGTPLVKFLHERGALNRLLFDLMSCAAFWLVALACGLFSTLPSINFSESLLRIGSASALAGLVYFVPIGRAFWLLLRNADAKQASRATHDFETPTDLD